MKLSCLSNKIGHEKSRRYFKILSNIIESGILTSKDIQKEIKTDFKFKKDKILRQLELVSREEFEVLKKIVEKQNIDIKKLQKTKNIKKVKRL